MGYASMGKIMWVDLSRGAISVESLPEDFYTKVLSGLGLAASLFSCGPKCPPMLLSA